MFAGTRSLPFGRSLAGLARSAQASARGRTGSYDVSVLFGNGDGTFRAAQNFAGGKTRNSRWLKVARATLRHLKGG